MPASRQSLSGRVWVARATWVVRGRAGELLEWCEAIEAKDDAVDDAVEAALQGPGKRGGGTPS